jgi:Xaa-Pro aminopeptidase
MKTDLDNLMQSRDLDALLITGPAQHNPPMYYLTGGVHLTSADLIKKRGEPPVLFFSPMERDEAARTGISLKSLGDYRLGQILKQNNGDLSRANVILYQKMLTDLGISSGRMAVYGKMDAGGSYALFSGLRGVLPELEIVGEMGDTLLLQAMATKDSAEVERMRRMGAITTEVVGLVADYLTSQDVEAEVLVKPDGQPLTIEDVKNRIQLWLAERGAEIPEGVIFAIGRDAGVPHSSGNAADFLRLGQTIVFDIFPCEAGGGYYYDFTRTWCLGYATDEVQAAYEDVRSVYQQILGELKADTPCHDYQVRTCQLFEERGHDTVHNNPETLQGYVHSLGHGLGLHVHELPRFGMAATENDRLVRGVVVTIEPGLYYPEKGFGIRLEDTVWVNPAGEMEILADYPLDLVLPMKSR